jgi:hypothetical protein
VSIAAIARNNGYAAEWLPPLAAGTLAQPKSFVSFNHHMRRSMAAKRELIEPHNDRRVSR